MSISFIVATTGRPSLLKTLESIEMLPSDELIVVGASRPEWLIDPRVQWVNCPRGNDWGSKERNIALPLARGQYIAQIDDDDYYRQGTRAIMQSAIAETPDRPMMFRMIFPNRIVLWQDKKIRCGNFGLPCPLVINDPNKLGVFAEGRDCGDFFFVESCKWAESDWNWRLEVIAILGNNPEVHTIGVN